MKTTPRTRLRYDSRGWWRVHIIHGRPVRFGPHASFDAAMKGAAKWFP